MRLSAVGDICHMLPVVRTLQQCWPDTHITWIIGKLEHTLVGDIPDIEFIIFDKNKGFSAYKTLHRQMRKRRFDLLLHMQMSLRASLASLLIPAGIKLGFDRRRANDLQWLFTNQRIPFHDRQHVMESFFEFIEALGIEQKNLEWNIPIPEQTHKKVASWLPSTPYIVISPCSSMPYRNWNSAGYAAVADHAAEKYHLRTVLTGGPSELERQFGEEITRLCRDKPLNLIGRTNLKELLAILERAQCLIAPDSGPAHMATAVDTPVIGLYATTNPDRARPYLSKNYVINRYPEAIQAKYLKTPEQLPWGTRVRDPGTMERISPNDVTHVLDIFMENCKPTPKKEK